MMIIVVSRREGAPTGSMLGIRGQAGGAASEMAMATPRAEPQREAGNPMEDRREDTRK
jgi:hypothetical protein